MAEAGVDADKWRANGGPMTILWLPAKDERRLQGTSWRS